MEEITLKEWSAYLPHRLKIQYKDCSNTNKKHTAFLTVITSTEIETTYPQKKKGCAGDIISFKGHNNINDLEVKPILRDLSDLTKEIEHNGEKIVPVVLLAKMRSSYSDSFPLEKSGKALINDLIGMRLPYDMVEKLLEWKFNVFQIPDELIVRVTEDFNPYK